MAPARIPKKNLFGEVNIGQRKLDQPCDHKSFREGLKNDFKLLNCGQFINKIKTSKPLLKAEMNGEDKFIKITKIPDKLGKL